MYPNIMCHICQQKEETQKHIMDKFEPLHPLITTKEEVFSEDLDQLKIIYVILCFMNTFIFSVFLKQQLSSWMTCF